MFFTSRSVQSLHQDAIHWNNHAQRLAHNTSSRNKNEDFINKAVDSMISDSEKLKDTLRQAIEAYLRKLEKSESSWERTVRVYMSKIPGGLFCSDVDRANKLRMQLGKAEKISQFIPALEEIIKDGDNFEDSLRVFIFDHIDKDFFGDKLLDVYASNVSYKGILKDIMQRVHNQLEQPICMRKLKLA